MAVAAQASGADLADSEWALSGTARKPIPDLIRDRILEMVRSGDLPPGPRLPTEPDLARMMRVARSTLRTALQGLQAEGVVTVSRGRGWHVTQEPGRSAADLMRDRMMERDFDIVDVMEVRIALEGAAAALAASRGSEKELKEIQRLVREHREASLDDPAALLRTDEEFHSAIVEASGNSYLQTLYAMLTPVIAEWRSKSFTSADVHDRSANDHHQIAVQLGRHDEVGARLTMTSHLLGLYKRVARERRDGSGEDHSSDPASAVTLSTYVDVDDQPMY